MSIFNKIKKRMSLALNPISADLKRLNKIKSGLGDDAYKFVTKGNHETVLATLSNVAAEGLLDVCRSYAHDKETQARRDILVDLTKKDLDTLSRYLTVLQTAQNPFPSNACGSDKCAGTIRIFFSEFFLVLDRYRYSSKEILNADVLSIDTASAVIQKLGGKQSDFIDVLYNNNGHWNMITGEAYRQHIDLKPFVLSNAAESLEGAQRMYAQGRADFIEDLRKWKIIEQEEILAFVLRQAGDASKVVREASLQALKIVAAEKIEQPAIKLLEKGTVNLRAGMVELLAMSGSERAMTALKTHRKKEKTARIKATIDNLFSIEKTMTSAELVDSQSAYTAIDGSQVDIPSLRPLNTGESVVFGAEDKAALRKIIDDENIKIKQQNEENKRSGYNYKRDLIKTTLADKTVTLFNQIESIDKLTIPADLEPFIMYGPANKWLLNALGRIPEDKVLAFCLKLTSQANPLVHSYANNVFIETISNYCSAPHADIRNLEQIKIKQQANYSSGGWRNKSKRKMQKGDLLRNAIPNDSYYQGTPDDLPNEVLWPYIAEQFVVLDEALGLIPQTEDKLSKVGAIRYLQVLPKTPMRYFSPLLEMATGTSKAGRLEARQMLEGVDGVEERLIALLDDSRQAIRAGAAEWLADLKANSAVKALKARLKKEKSEIARAAILTCLDKLNEDLSDYLGPKALLDEAEKGLKRANFSKLDWLAMTHLSSFKYKSGRKVPTEVPRWWLFLAVKLKQPEGNKLFDIYLEQLADDDAEAFSSWVFNSWINYDTAKAPEEESNAYAKAHVKARYNSYKQWYEDYTEEQAFLDLKREHQAGYLNSGAATKGLLALAKKAPPAMVADAVRAYLKNHGSRTSQASSLLQLLANVGDPVALQVIISAATRLKQKGVQKFAGSLLQQVASDRNWSLDELADRTIPTAGLDENGLLDLPCANGEKVYQAFLDDALKLGLRNPAGKVVKALSAGTDDGTKASKKQLSASRRELKQVVAMQSSRLYESLCAERVWSKEDWTRDFRDHPIMRRITERVVWLALDKDEKLKTSFRPTAEGDYTDAEDDTVDPNDYAFFKLAHAALLDDDAKESWLEHLKDYEVKAIFPQFDRPLLALQDANSDDESISDKKIEDRKGWVTDTFTVRGFASKLGYDRGETLDAGYFNEYRKSFTSAGLVSVIEFSGNCLPEENVPAALISLSFEKISGNNRTRGEAKLVDVPPVLLSECWNDYYAMAAKATYDKDWLKKMPWM